MQLTIHDFDVYPILINMDNILDKQDEIIHMETTVIPSIFEQ